MKGVTTIAGNNALSFTQGGSNNEPDVDVGGFRGRNVLYGDRYADLDKRQSYYEGTQHDSKHFDFDGRVWNPRSAQPLLGVEKASFFVPLRMRRPNAPYRLPKVIVDSFTNLLFGENRFPGIRAPSDPKTEEYAQAISREGDLPIKMIRARSLGGSMGTVGISWCFRLGKPIYETHISKNLHVHSWEDRENLIPKHVTEVYPYPKVMWNGKKFARVWFWYRRDWTPDWDVAFRPVLHEEGKEPYWEMDKAKSVRHGDGTNHFVWIQNLPSDDIDGFPDYDGLYDQFDTLDLLSSVVARGAVLNLDPTLLLKMDPEQVNRMGVKKGSDNALSVGKDGDASYMELAGSSIDAGVKLIEHFRKSILETAQCVVPDPHEVAAQGVSSVAIKAMHAPMLGKADILRAQYGTGIERLLEVPIVVMRAKSTVRVTVVDDETGEESEGIPSLDLPPKVEEEPENDPTTGEPTGEIKRTLVPLEPGEAEELDLQWPAYFPPTPQDQASIATTLTTATGGKSFMSKQTATEVSAMAFGLDPAAEWKRVEEQGHKDKAEEAEKQKGMFPGGLGGDVDSEDELPPGATPKRETGFPKKPKDELNKEPKEPTGDV